MDSKYFNVLLYLWKKKFQNKTELKRININFKYIKLIKTTLLTNETLDLYYFGVT